MEDSTLDLLGLHKDTRRTQRLPTPTGGVEGSKTGSELDISS